MNLKKPILDKPIEYDILSIEEATVGANKELRHLRIIFNFGKKKQIIVINPTDGIEFFPVTQKIKYVPSSADIEKALSFAGQEIMDYLMAVKDTMARVSEINRLTWDDLDLGNNYLVLYTRKKRAGI